MARTKIGDRATCERCGQDIEWHGTPKSEPPSGMEGMESHLRAWHPTMMIVSGGWLDRGGNRNCIKRTQKERRIHKPCRAS